MLMANTPPGSDLSIKLQTSVVSLRKSIKTYGHLNIVHCVIHTKNLLESLVMHLLILAIQFTMISRIPQVPMSLTSMRGVQLMDPSIMSVSRTWVKLACLTLEVCNKYIHYRATCFLIQDSSLILF